VNDLITSPPSPWMRAGRVLVAGLVGSAVVTALGLGVHQVMRDESFRVFRVEIAGNQRASETQLRHLADVPEGAHLATVDLDHIRRGVERHPWVAHATVQRQFPSGIQVTVTEYEPTLLLALDRLWYVDDSGRPIKPAESDDLDYPVLTGLDLELAHSRPELAQAVVQGALRVLAACNGEPVAPAAVSEIHFDVQTGYELVLRGGSRLILGEGDPTPPLDRLRQLLAAGLDLDTPQRVDLAVETVAVATPIPPLQP